MINELRRSYGMRPAIHVILISIAATLCSADEASPTAPLKSEIPPVFTANTESFDFVRRTEMIPMRDGVKLQYPLQRGHGSIFPPYVGSPIF
jgi:predicted acyl esterase